MAESPGPEEIPTPSGPVTRCFTQAGQIYYGEVKEDEAGGLAREGRGIQVTTAVTIAGETITLSRYDGDWSGDKMTGAGTTTWSDGSTYEGELLNGQPHGKGKLLWPDKSYYDGCWSLGEYHGEGSFYCALDGSALKGTFRRNSFLSRDGKWIDASKLREEQHLRSLRISPANSASATVPIIRCTPEEVGAKILAVQREAPFFVPLVLADASCGEAAPLALLELGDRGCTEATTVHLAHAANEKRRQRDHLQIFRSAMNEAVQTDRPFVLAFGDGAGSGNPQEDEDRLPAAWSLDEFFDRCALPQGIFDPAVFNASQEVQLYLPPEKRGLKSEEEPTPTAPPAEEVRSASKTSKAEEESQPAAPPPPKLGPPTVFRLNVALASQRRVDSALAADDEWVARHVARRFSAAVPLQRVAVVVVSAAQSEPSDA